MLMWHISRSQSISEERVVAETCFRRDPKQTGKESYLLTCPGFLSYRVHNYSPMGGMMPPTVNWAFLGQLKWWRLFPTVVSTGKSNPSNPSIEPSFSFDFSPCQSNSWPKQRRTATKWMSGHPDFSAKNLALMWEKKGMVLENVIGDHTQPWRKMMKIIIWERISAENFCWMW